MASWRIEGERRQEMAASGAAIMGRNMLAS